MSKTKTAKGILIYEDEILKLLDEDYTNEEIGIVLREGFNYFLSGHKTKLDDRGMRGLARDLYTAADRSQESYLKKCEENKARSERAKGQWDERKRRDQERQNVPDQAEDVTRQMRDVTSRGEVTPIADAVNNCVGIPDDIRASMRAKGYI